MKKLKYQILFIILFITIGVAAVTSNLVINGNTNIASNPDDFLVYFSDAKIDGVQDLSLVDNETSLVFNKELSAVGQSVVITYDVTNASKNYDADVNITCTPSTDYLTISNSFDTSNNLSARATRSGTLSITLSKSYTGVDLSQEISCTINVSAVERTSQGTSSVLDPLTPYYVGREISIGEEKFNIIRDNGTTVSLLAQYNIDNSTYKQTTTQISTTFSDSYGWEYTPGPKEIDIQTWGGEARTILNNYVSYLQTDYNVYVSGDLITMNQLGELGCLVSDDYTWGDVVLTCNNSEYSDWIGNGQYWWTRSACAEDSICIWVVNDDGTLSMDTHIYPLLDYGVRPVITVSKEELEK